MNFRPARRSEAKPLIGLYSESGCGKTLSALMLARGFVGPEGSIGMIESEAGRGEAYQGDPRVGDYLVCPIRESFSPKNYEEAIVAAEKATLDALIIDSASHEWEGINGVLHMASANMAAGKKGVQAWTQPKMDHQRHFMGRLLGTPIPLVVVCMRAKYPMREDKQKKEWIRSEELEPKQADDILFEMFLHGWIDRAHKFHGTKYTLDSLRKVIVDGEPISVASGERLAAWAKGESTPRQLIPAEIDASLRETTQQALTPAMADVGREILKGSIHRAAQAKGMTKGIPKEVWVRHCGAGTWDTVDLSALHSLYEEISK